MGRYKTPADYRSALETKIISQRDTTSMPVGRLRKSVAFDAFLARLSQANTGFVLKGGFALELRLQLSRSTKDLDFVLKSELRQSSKGTPKLLREILERALSKTMINTDDRFFEFIISEATIELNTGGWRYKVQSRLDGRKFEDFHIDVSSADYLPDNIEVLAIESRARPSGEQTIYKVEIVTAEQHFAEKLHAYTLPRQSENSRTKDLIDMYLLINHGLDTKVANEMITAVFSHRETHQPPLELPAPPQSWEAQYLRMTSELGITTDLQTMYASVSQYVKSISQQRP